MNNILLLIMMVIPQTVTVRVTGQHQCTPDMTYHTEVMDFKEYVKGVLPAEWGRDWDEDSLRAGAVAVKMFAWRHMLGKGYVWDCNCYSQRAMKADHTMVWGLYPAESPGFPIS